MTELAKSVYDDIIVFMGKADELMFNERDFQMHLAMYLISSGNYDDVDLEYHIPIGFNELFDKDYSIWKTEKPSIDIVVRKGGEYVPIELKYKLKAINADISRFGIKSGKQIQIISNQSAQNLGRYAFWKDVRRIELLKKHFSNVHNGLSVFLTNDDSYMNSSEGTNYYSFRMNEGRTATGQMEWQKVKEGYPSFQLEGKYAVKWNKISIHKELMPKAFYTIVTV